MKRRRCPCIPSADGESSGEWRDSSLSTITRSSARRWRARFGTVDAEADVFEATSIEGALDVLDAHDDFELALLDLSLPGAPGFSGLIRMRATRPKLPILVVSGHEEPAIVREALALGVAGYVPKSTSKKRLAEAVAKALAGDVYEPELPPASPIEPRPADEQQIIQRLKDLTPQQLAVLELVRAGLPEQGDRARTQARRNHDQGAYVGDLAQARRRVAHPGRDRGRQGRFRGDEEGAAVESSPLRAAKTAGQKASVSL